MNVKIRKATLEDTSFLNLFLTKLIQDEKKYDSNINENCVVKSYYENIVQNNQVCILVAEIQNQKIGYLYGYIENIGDTYLCKISQLDALYVEEKYRNMGVANMLINEFEMWAKKKKVRYIELKVCNKNINAVNLYKKNNYKEIKTILLKEVE